MDHERLVRLSWLWCLSSCPAGTDGKGALQRGSGPGQVRQRAACCEGSACQKCSALSRAVEIFEEAGSIDFARDYSFKLTAQAKELLANVELDNHCKELFMSMADFFVERLS